MSPSPSDPMHVDVEKLAEQAQEFGGSTPLRRLARLTELAHADAQPAEDDAVLWRVRGERRQVRGQGLQTWLHLHAATRLAVTCQRCLQPLLLPLAIERSFRFVHGEDEAARLDAESDEDVLATSRAFDVLALVEDELLLSLPLVPRHDNCRMQLPPSEVTPDFDSDAVPRPDDAQPNPFAVLAALKGGRRGN